VYLLSLSYDSNNSTAAQNAIGINTTTLNTILNLSQNMSGLEVRVSYFGFCLMLNSSLSACSNDIGALQQSVDGHDPLNLMWMAKKFHDETIFSGLM